MSWPSNSKASNQYTDQATDLISDARADINQTILNVNAIIDNFDIANPTDGDQLVYNSSAGAWQPGAPSNQTLFIPLGAFVENTWSQDANTVADKVKFFRKCVLGGQYWDPFANSGTGGYVAARTIYGSIRGSSVVRSNPTLTTPANSTITAPNINVILNDGIASYGSGNNLANVVGSGTNRSYKYATYSDNYIELPAGTYKISFEHDGVEQNIASIPHGAGLRDVPAFSDFVIYNATDNVDIKSIEDFSDFQRNFVYFTLTGTKRIEIYNRGVTDQNINDDIDDVLQVALFASQSSLTTGYLKSSLIAYFGTSDSSTWSPAFLGLPTSMGNRYMKIEKL